MADMDVIAGRTACVARAKLRASGAARSLAGAIGGASGRGAGGPPDEIHRLAADVFAPCALGACLNDRTVLKLAAVDRVHRTRPVWRPGRHRHGLHGLHGLAAEITWAILSSAI
ncbi:hypothetical protein [Caulobacter sp.]|uniref:hypothetical protein n=1 Tax=Caulobacter sp. TaxID=78 RepID=UPI003BB0FF94